MPDTPAAQASTTDLANAIRALAMDAVQKANSGHPGMPMGMAEIAVALWKGALRHNPANPAWPDRDRFVLSNGHGSMLLYALLHLTGYDLPMEEIRNFRQLHSKTPGHPEFGYTPGVETTTGPLGQGLANAVGFALAERLLADRFNQPGHAIVDHRTWVFAGDGCLMEGISHEACSLAGVLGLGKLVMFYDDNGISIDGKVEAWFRDDTPKRFAAYGWNVIPAVDGHDVNAVAAAIEQAKRETSRPTLICCRTVIGKGSPNKAGTDAVHGAALGDKEVAATRESIGWKHAAFEIPEAVYRGWDAREKGASLEREWNERFTAYEKAHSELAAEFRRRMSGALPDAWTQHVEALVEKSSAKAENVATRKASQLAIEALAPHLPELVGGSADLTGSNLTNWSGTRPVAASGGGNYVYFGVREFGMAAIGNGLALHGGFIPYSGTFLTFSDYSRNALRMAALMRARNIFVFTHDSIGLGEDGPTHQAVEHVSSLRLIPRMDVWRPCDTTETAMAWAMAIERRDGPSCLALSRQNLPFVKRSPDQVAAIRRGGYVLSEAAGARAAILATGSEVMIALEAQKALAAAGLPVRVVSMPCTSVFDQQDAAWRESVLPKGMPRVAIEAGVTDFWRKYVGLEGAAIGVDRYGESAPAPAVYKHLGVDVDHLVAAVKNVAA
jgi:transketolase